MNKTLKIVLISVIAVVVIAAITLGSMVLATLYKKRDTRGTPFESEYVLDESGCFIANIPFEKYLNVQSKFYKYSVANTILILAQNSNVNVLKDELSWKRESVRIL